MSVNKNLSKLALSVTDNGDISNTGLSGKYSIDISGDAGTLDGLNSTALVSNTFFQSQSALGLLSATTANSAVGSATYTVPAGVNYIAGFIVGGGGGGGRVRNNSSGGVFGGHGGCGAICAFSFAVTPGATYNYKIGAGVAGTAPSNAASLTNFRSDGGQSNFDGTDDSTSTYRAEGGKGGQDNSGTTALEFASASGGGRGGDAFGGLFNIRGAYLSHPWLQNTTGSGHTGLEVEFLQELQKSRLAMPLAYFGVQPFDKFGTTIDTSAAINQLGIGGRGGGTRPSDADYGADSERTSDRTSGDAEDGVLIVYEFG